MTRWSTWLTSAWNEWVDGASSDIAETGNAATSSVNPGAPMVEGTFPWERPEKPPS